MGNLVWLPAYSKHWRADAETALLRVEEPGPLPVYFRRNLFTSSREDWVGVRGKAKRWDAVPPWRNQPALVKAIRPFSWRQRWQRKKIQEETN